MKQFDILFVEDDSVIAFLVARYKFWEKGEFRIKHIASNGKEALQYLETDNVDIVITDIRMPVMDGMELFRKIRDKGIQVGVILASNYCDFSYAKEGIRLGAIDYIEKPYSEDKMLAALELARAGFSGDVMIEKWVERIYHDMRDGFAGKEELKEQLFQDFCKAYSNDEDRIAKSLEEILRGVWTKFTGSAPWMLYMYSFTAHVTSNYEATFGRTYDELGERIAQQHITEYDNTVQRMTNLIHEHIREERLQDFLSEQLEFSKDYIGKLFKNRTGMTLLEYCTIVKMEKAKEMLQSTNKKVYEISQELGYTTVDYFTRLFKKYTGVTPAQYKKQT